MQQSDDPPEPAPPYSNGKKMEEFLQQFDTRIVEASQNGGLVNITEAEADLANHQLHADILERPEETIHDLEVHLDRLWKFPGRLALVEMVNKLQLHDLREDHLYQYISVPCIVQKVYDVQPAIIKAVWKCGRCGCDHERPNPIHNQLLLEDVRECIHCNRKGNQTRFALVPEYCTYVDFQMFEVQEPPDGLRGRHQPSKLECIVRPHLVGEVFPGDRVILNGIYKPVVRGNQKKSQVLEKRLEVYAIEKSQAEMDEDLTIEDIEEIKRLALDPDVLMKMARSLAPHIYGLDHIKLSLLLQMFGGVPRDIPDMSHNRGDIHTLLLGDPGTAKSALCRTMAMIHPRGHIADGGSSSAVGLTAAAVKNKDDVFCIEAGPLVMADQGLVFIDELDKIGEFESSKLNEAMEDQTVSLNKAGAHIQLSARCSVLAAANPKHDRFDTFSPILPQANVVNQTTLSRFDVIFFLRDRAKDDEEEMVARAMLREARSDVAEVLKREVDVSLIRKYVAYAREQVKPEMTDEAEEIIFATYIKKRKNYMMTGPDDGDGVVDRRKLRALVRLSQASARARLSKVVTVDDAALACTILFEWALQDIRDPEANRLNIELMCAAKEHLIIKPLNVGPKGQKRPSDHPDILRVAYKICEHLSLKDLDSTFTKNEWLAHTIDDPRFAGQNLEKLLEIMHSHGYIQTMGQDKYRAVK